MTPTTDIKQPTVLDLEKLVIKHLFLCDSRGIGGSVRQEIQPISEHAVTIASIHQKYNIPNDRYNINYSLEEMGAQNVSEIDEKRYEIAKTRIHEWLNTDKPSRAVVGLSIRELSGGVPCEYCEKQADYSHSKPLSEMLLM